MSERRKLADGRIEWHCRDCDYWEIVEASIPISKINATIRMLLESETDYKNHEVVKILEDLKK